MRVDLEPDAPVDLVAVAAGALLLDLVVVLWPGSLLRLALGLPFVLFLPGYALVAALFPEGHRRYEVEKGPYAREETVEEGVDGFERVVLSLGLSIAVVALLGLGLNYTPWGIRPRPFLAAITAFILLTSGVGAWRRSRLPYEDRFRVHVRFDTVPWGERSRLDQVLTVALAASILAAVGTLGYVLLNPNPGEGFTEFYVLGPGGNATSYPTNLSGGEEASLVLGVRNHEHRTVDYVAEAWLVDQDRPRPNGTGGNGSAGGAEIRSLYFLERWGKRLPSRPTPVEPGQPYDPQWEWRWNFSLEREGTWKLAFVLFGDGLGGDQALRPAVNPGEDAAGTRLEERYRSAYRSLRLWVTVR